MSYFNVISQCFVEFLYSFFAETRRSTHYAQTCVKKTKNKKNKKNKQNKTKQKTNKKTLANINQFATLPIRAAFKEKNPSGHMMLIQRRLNVDATLSRRCINVMCPLGCISCKIEATLKGKKSAIPKFFPLRVARILQAMFRRIFQVLS